MSLARPASVESTARPAGVPPGPIPPEPAPRGEGQANRVENLLKRLASSAVLITVVLATLFWFPLWAFAAVVIGFIGLALGEFFTMVRHRGILVHRPMSVALGVVFAGLVAWRSLVEPGYLVVPIDGQGALLLRWGWDIFWPATIVVIFLRQFTRQNTFEALSGLATTLFGLAYISGLLGYLFYIRTLKGEDGGWLICFLILVTKMGDAGAFAIGSLLGTHTLLPRISPRKTIEGFIGGALVSAAVAAVAAPMVPRLGGSPILGFWLGLFLGVLGQMGDLAESLIKRDCQVKDSGRLLPGLGGVLDVLDSLLFTTPLFYAFLIYR